MPISSYFVAWRNKAQGHWQALIQPPDKIQEEGERRKARLLSALVVALLMAMTVILPIWILANPEFVAALYISFAILAFLSLTYYLSRIGYYRLGAYLLIALFPATIVSIILTAPGPMTERMLALNFQVVALLLAGILLSIRETAVIGILSVIGISAFVFVPDVSFPVVYSYIVYVSIMSALFIVASAIRQNYSQQLHQSEERYRSLFEQSGDAVFILDLMTNRLEANQRAADMLGYTYEEINALPFEEIFAPAEHSDVKNVLKRLINNEQLPLFERLFRRKDGSTVPAEVNIKLVRDSKANPLHIQGVVRDITERKRIQEQAFALAIEHERLNILNQFIQDASHEFRTPLLAINTNLYLMLKETDDQKLKELAKRGELNVSRLTKLLDMMLAMVKLESHSTFDFKAGNINMIVHLAQDKVVDMYAAKNHTNTLLLDPTLPHLCFDETWLVTALINVLENATQFTPEHGTIHIRTYTRNASVVVEIEDNGIGMDETTLSHILEPFWRFDVSRTTPGFGLGLPIAQKIVERHGGTLEIASWLGKGSVFRFVLPIPPTHMECQDFVNLFDRETSLAYDFLNSP